MRLGPMYHKATAPELQRAYVGEQQQACAALTCDILQARRLKMTHCTDTARMHTDCAVAQHC